MATTGYIAQGSRREQMKRELIGLVIGTTLLMAGMAFLFSQTIIASNPVASVASEPEVVTGQTVTPPPLMAASPSIAIPPVSADKPDVAKTIIDVPAVAATNMAANDVAVTPVKSPDPSNAVMVVPEANVVTEEQAATTGRTGWIYAGQFANGKWTEQGLKIGAELPAIGGKYALAWDATVREHPPGKRSEAGGKLGKTVANLASGREVEIVQVKKSGSKGHVWLEVKLQ
jgi:hypothetical protein